MKTFKKMFYSLKLSFLTIFINLGQLAQIIGWLHAKTYVCAPVVVYP